MNTPELLVLSRTAAMAYEPTAAVEVCISISNPGGIEVDVPLSPRFAEVLRLTFSDIAGPSSFPFDILFSDEDARAIINFVERWRASNRLVIHCVGGRSRSPAVALAILDLIGIPAGDLEQQYPLWNTWVRSAIVRCGRLGRSRADKGSRRT